MNANEDNPTAESISTEGASDGPIVLFDGVCDFCEWSVRFIYHHDDGALRFAPLQSEIGTALLAEHDLSPDYLDSLVYVQDGEIYIKSDAAVRIARHLAIPWRWTWHLRHVPRSVRDVGYDFFAGVRYRLFGRKKECMKPEEGLRERFVTNQGDDK